MKRNCKRREKVFQKERKEKVLQRVKKEKVHQKEKRARQLVLMENH